MPLRPGKARAARSATSASALSAVAMHPPCAPRSRRIRVSFRVSMPAIATVSPSTQELLERMARAPARVQERQVADDEARGVDGVGLEVLGRDAGIADVRVGQRDDLAGIGRVGQDLLVARHRRVEHDFAGRDAGRPDGNAPKHRAVLECEHCRRRCHQGVLPVPPRRLPARGAGRQWVEPSGTPPVIVCCYKGAATRVQFYRSRRGQSRGLSLCAGKGTVPSATARYKPSTSDMP